MLAISAVAPAALGSCAPTRDQTSATIIVFSPGSLARPLSAALDSLRRAQDIGFVLEPAGSLETARKITDLGRTPDIVALADAELFAQLLVPEFTSWYVEFARDRMVIAHTASSRYAPDVSPATWTTVLARAEVEVGRSDPHRDPAGYRALLAMQLAASHHADPSLADRLLARSPVRNVRPKSADLVALLQAGALDYAWLYESTARSAGLHWIDLPDAINLGAPADSAGYAAASVRVVGRTLSDTILVRGAPIVFALSIPSGASNRDRAVAAARFLLWSAEGRSMLTAHGISLLPSPRLVGSGFPAGLLTAAAQ